MAFPDTNTADQGADTDTEVDAFDLAVDEALAQREKSPADTGDDEPGDPDGPAAGEGEPGSAQTEAREDQPAGGADAQPPAGQPTQDIWQNATEEQRAAFQAALAERDQLSTKVTRLIGQVSAADRQLARLRSQSGATSGQQGDSGQDSGNAADPFEAEDIKRWREEYGEIADPVLKLLKSQAAEIAALKAPVAEVAQEREAQVRTAEIETFTRAHPDWEAYVNDQRYPEWLATQPKAVRDAAQRAVNVEDGAEAAWLLSQFKASIGAGGSAPSPDPRPGSGKPTPSLTDLKRQRQLGAGRDGGGSAAPMQTGIPDDFDAATAAAEAALERRRQAQLR